MFKAKQGLAPKYITELIIHYELNIWLCSKILKHFNYHFAKLHKQLYLYIFYTLNIHTRLVCGHTVSCATSWDELHVLTPVSHSQY